MKDRYQSVIAPTAPQAPIAPGQEGSVKQREPNVRSDIVVPFGQALVTACIRSFLVLIVAGGAVFLLRGDGVWLQGVGLLVLLTFGLSLAQVWPQRLEWAESTIRRAESLTGIDWNHDGEVEEPPHFFSVRGSQSQRPVDPVEQERQRLEAFVRYAFDHGTATDVLLAKFSRQEIGRFRALLMRQDVGCAEWVNPRAVNQGWQFVGTRDGVLKTIDALEAVETVGRTRHN